MLYSYSWVRVTATAVADTAAYTNTGYPGFIQGGSSTMRLSIREIMISGLSAASTPTNMIFSRDSTVAASSIAGGFTEQLDASGVAPGTVAVVGNSSTTKPQRSSTKHLLALALDTYGGIVRWVPRDELGEVTVVGNTASLGEASLSSENGAGITSGHIVFELK